MCGSVSEMTPISSSHVINGGDAVGLGMKM